MTRTCPRAAIPRPSSPSATPAPTWSILLGRAVVGFFREARRTSWSSAIGRLAPGRHLRPILVESAARLAGGRRTPSRSFQPAVDGRLEVRVLLSHGLSARAKHFARLSGQSLTQTALSPNTSAGTRFVAASHYLLKHQGARSAYNLNQPDFLAYHSPYFNNIYGFRVRSAVATQTVHGGQAVEVTALDGSHYMIKLSYTSNTLSTNISEGNNGQAGNSTPAAAAELVSQQNVNYPQPIGTVRAYAMPGGRVGIIVDGSTPNTDLTINPLGEPQRKGYAHSFAYGEAGRTHLLNIGQLTVTSGQIGGIEGYQDAELSGPLQVTGTSPIDRIALDAILPGASIVTGGDLETLDVLNQIDLSGPGTGITIGRDLNLLNSGGPITLSNGANFQIGRDLGLLSQSPKGTGTGSNVLALNYTTVSNQFVIVTIPSVGAFIQGGITIDPGSRFTISGNIFNTLYTEGTINGYSRLFINYGLLSQANPPFIQSLAAASTAPPSTTGVAPTGYVTAIGGVIP